MAKGLKFSLKRQHRDATKEIAKLNREMALRMIALANETGEVKPLIDAVKALGATAELYSQDTASIELARIQKKLGDVLLSVGESEANMQAIEAAIAAYKGAITLASILGVQNLRQDARKNYTTALNYIGRPTRRQSISLIGAA